MPMPPIQICCQVIDPGYVEILVKGHGAAGVGCLSSQGIFSHKMTAEKQIIGTAPFGYLCKIGILQSFSTVLNNDNERSYSCLCLQRAEADYQNAAAPFLPEQLRKPGPGKIRRTEMRFIHPYGYYGFTEFIQIPHISSYETLI